MFQAEKIKEIIETALPGAVAHVVDDANDGEHFSGEIMSPSFVGVPLVRQHQQVYGALGPRMGREIHAFTFKTFTPEQWAKKQESSR